MKQRDERPYGDLRVEGVDLVRLSDLDLGDSTGSGYETVAGS